jgi:glycosyltransferase involved in cell wall biosynthesis
MTHPTRKKILFLITKSNWGGAQRYVFDLANNLPSDQFDVSVATGGDGMLVEKLQHAGLKVHLLKDLKRDVSVISEIKVFFSLLKLIQKERPDILHLNSSKAGALGAIIGRICRVPKILFTAHGWAFNEDRPQWQKTVLKTIHWLTIKLSHVTIAVSQGMKKEMDWLGVEKKMVVVHLGRTVADMKYKDESRGTLEMKVIDTTARLIDYHDDLWIGTIAELHPIKRINRAINAVSALIKDFPGLRFIIIHDGELKAELQQQVKDLGLQEHVFFTGVIEDAARLLPAFDLFVLPSKSEAFGYVLIEAGLASVPVVATEVGGITDIITNGENGLLVPPDDTPALTQAIRTVISNDDLRHSLARAHYERSMTFTVEKMIKETRQIYLA